MASRAILLFLGETALQLGRLKEAESYLRKFLTGHPAGPQHLTFEQVRAALNRAR